MAETELEMLFLPSQNTDITIDTMLQDFPSKMQSFFHKNWKNILILAGTYAVDAAATLYLLNTYPAHVDNGMYAKEMHPYINWLCRSIGNTAGVIIPKIASGMAACALTYMTQVGLHKEGGIYFLIGPSAACGLVALHNIATILRSPKVN
jgi:hypothetical protein